MQAENSIAQTGTLTSGDATDAEAALTSKLEVVKARAELLQEMKVTKGCRFNASKRLERRDKRMITITAFASVLRRYTRACLHRPRRSSSRWSSLLLTHSTISVNDVR